MQKTWEHFDYSEFECPCCQENLTKTSLVSRLDSARDRAKVPFIIPSGYRCAKHNDAVGGTPGSAHRTGDGADIETPDNHTRYKVLEALLHFGFRRIGVYEHHIHVDQSAVLPQQLIWRGEYRDE